MLFIAGSLTFLLDVWLRFWAEADEAKPGTRTGMYFGVYAMFAVAGLIIIGADVW